MHVRIDGGCGPFADSGDMLLQFCSPAESEEGLRGSVQGKCSITWACVYLMRCSMQVTAGALSLGGRSLESCVDCAQGSRDGRPHFDASGRQGDDR